MAKPRQKPAAAQAEPTSKAQSAVDRRARRADPLLVETAWEVVNQVGGIYTVIRSKLQAMTEKWGGRYCLLGPYVPQTASVEFEPAAPSGPFGAAAKAMHPIGLRVHFGRWLVVGRPRVVLLDLNSARRHLEHYRWLMWEHHRIPMPTDSPLITDVTLFGYMVEQFLAALGEQQKDQRPVIGQFHEWMGGLAIPELRRRGAPLHMVFTTHATMLGRYVAANDPWYYDHVPFVNWAADAKRFNIEPQVCIERAAAHGAHVLTTVSNVTAFECEHLLGRKVDVVTPNGLNIERFVALHEFQVLHRQYKEKIHEFVMGHFFPTYSFDLDRTLYVFTSGRFEYSNKGFDLTIESLARLNWRLKQAKLDRTVVAFLITKRPYRGITSAVLNSRGVMDELRDTCNHIKEQVGERLFYAAARGRRPHLDDLVDQYWRLRLRRTMQAWKTGQWPGIVTHDLEDAEDPVIKDLRRCHLLNSAEDPVKVVYHPDFITATNPLWGIDYDQFVRGCHVGVFPSFYEPWGYTPLECIALGIPAIASDVSGFGSYVMQNIPRHDDAGMFILHRRYAGFDTAAERLTDILFKLVSLQRRDRISLRNHVDRAAEHFDWSNLVQFYDQAYDLALQR